MMVGQSAHDFAQSYRQVPMKSSAVVSEACVFDLSVPAKDYSRRGVCGLKNI
jgi:hypothetical protein